jgi:hypothetical protein
MPQSHFIQGKKAASKRKRRKVKDSILVLDVDVSQTAVFNLEGAVIVERYCDPCTSKAVISRVSTDLAV